MKAEGAEGVEGQQERQAQMSPYRTLVMEDKCVCVLRPLGCYWLYFRCEGIGLTL